MKSQRLVAIAVIAAIVLAALSFVLLPKLRRGGATTSAVPASERLFVSDSLGVRLRLPATSGWSLRREAAGSTDGRVASATHEDGTAIVSLFALPAIATTTLDDVFRSRQRQIAAQFGADDLDQVVAKVLKDERRDVDGRPYRQWQAISKPTTGPDEQPCSIAFMWLMTLQPQRSLECIGLVRLPVKPTSEQQKAIDGLLQDVAYILQSFEVR